MDTPWDWNLLHMLELDLFNGEKVINVSSSLFSSLHKATPSNVMDQ